MRNWAFVVFYLTALFYFGIRPVVLLYFDLGDTFSLLNPNFSIKNIDSASFTRLHLFIIIFVLLMEASTLIYTRPIQKINTPTKGVTALVAFLFFVIVFSFSSIAMILYVTTLYWCLLLMEKTNNVKLLWFILLVISFSTITEERRDIAILLLGFVILFIEKHQLDISFKLISFSLLLGITGLVFAVYMRNNIISQGFGKLDKEAVVKLLLWELDFSHVYDSSLILFNDGASRIKSGGIHFIKPLFYLIPRDIWVDKPITMSKLYSKMYNYGFFKNGGSEPVTLFGELYIAFRYLGVLAGFCFGMILKRIEVRYSSGRISISMYAVFSGFLFFIFRGPFDTMILYLLLLYFTNFVFLVLFRLRVL